MFLVTSVVVVVVPCLWVFAFWRGLFFIILHCSCNLLVSILVLLLRGVANDSLESVDMASCIYLRRLVLFAAELFDSCNAGIGLDIF